MKRLKQFCLNNKPYKIQKFYNKMYKKFPNSWLTYASTYETEEFFMIKDYDSNKIIVIIRNK